MNYLSAFRDPVKAQHLSQALKVACRGSRTYRFMEFCGGHTHAICRYGIEQLLPDAIRLIHGPGCPVCVLPISRIDYAIALALLPSTILCTYADMLRVPGSHQRSLSQARAEGANVQAVYSVEEALTLARNNPAQQVIFFAIGFETTTPPTALALQRAKAESLNNFTVFCNHVLTPVAMAHLLELGDTKLDGFIGPAHVSVVIGSDAYAQVARQYGKPVVIAGFEPLDILYSILQLVRLCEAGQSDVVNAYSRAVEPKGNVLAQQVMQDVFVRREQFEWRGLGDIPHSAVAIASEYAEFDAEVRFPMRLPTAKPHKACVCGKVLQGLVQPRDCKVFATVCTPDNPLGACMVSSEGACAAHYHYQRVKENEVES